MGWDFFLDIIHLCLWLKYRKYKWTGRRKDKFWVFSPLHPTSLFSLHKHNFAKLHFAKESTDSGHILVCELLGVFTRGSRMVIPLFVCRGLQRAPLWKWWPIFVTHRPGWLWVKKRKLSTCQVEQPVTTLFCLVFHGVCDMARGARLISNSSK